MNIKIDGIVSVERDTLFDDEKAYRSGGIRLFYETKTDHIEGVKEGILLEAGFDTITPNTQLTISSWVYDKIADNKVLEIIDNRAVGIVCYHPGYTFVEKLQTIATKFRQEQETGIPKPNLMRQYYDIYCLLDNSAVQDFINTDDYQAHKGARFPKQDYAIPIAQNQAFLLDAPELRAQFRKRYQDTAALYYQAQPDFEDLLGRLKTYIGQL